MKRITKSPWGILLGFLAGVIIGLILPRVIPSFQGSVSPILVDGSASCNQLVPGTTELIVNQPQASSFSDGTRTVTVTNYNSTSFDFQSTVGVKAVLVSAGDQGNLYIYNPEIQDDNNLKSVSGSSGQLIAINHISFCYEGEALAITSTVTPKPFEGCTLFYWKMPKHYHTWTAAGFSIRQTLESVFDVPDAFGLDNTTLPQALDLSGGSGTIGAAPVLFRAAVAALLNSAHPGVNYPRKTDQIIADVNAALASNDRDTMLTLGSALDADNDLGCPLS